MAPSLAISPDHPAELSFDNFESGVATRARHDAPENGDGFLFTRDGSIVVQCLVDGLGHGPQAQRAAQTAVRHMQAHPGASILSLFEGVESACRHTRGVVMAVARFDLARQTATLGSIGNIEIRLQGGAEPFRPLLRRGIVGAHAPAVATTEHCWSPESLLVMHTDGVKPHWHWRDLPSATLSPHAMARHLLTEFGRSDDDATVIVTRGVAQ